MDDDSSIAWSPDGCQLLGYGGLGQFLLDAATGGQMPLTDLTGYDSVAWLLEPCYAICSLRP